MSTNTNEQLVKSKVETEVACMRKNKARLELSSKVSKKKESGCLKGVESLVIIERLILIGVCYNIHPYYNVYPIKSTDTLNSYVSYCLC